MLAHCTPALASSSHHSRTGLSANRSSSTSLSLPRRRPSSRRLASSPGFSAAAVSPSFGEGSTIEGEQGTGHQGVTGGRTSRRKREPTQTRGFTDLRSYADPASPLQSLGSGSRRPASANAERPRHLDGRGSFSCLLLRRRQSPLGSPGLSRDAAQLVLLQRPRISRLCRPPRRVYPSRKSP